MFLKTIVMKNIFLLFLFFITAALAQAQFPANNKSVHFSNATDEGISIPNNNLMDFTASQNFTIEAWVKTNDAVNAMFIFDEQYCPGPSTGVLLYVINGKASLGLDANTSTYTTVTSNCSIADGNWHHVAAVRNVTTDSVYIYIDGVENGRALDITTGTLTDANASYWVGRRTWCGNVGNFYGDIDEVRVWHKAKSQSEIIAEKDMQLTGNETTLKLYYDFNTAANGNGQTVVNNCSLTGGSLNGTIVGTTTEPSFALAQPSGIFVPCDPVLWLKADAAVYADAGVTLATNGQTVQQWNDQSGNGYNASQSDNTKRPTWQQYAFNGKPALWFDGTTGNYFLNNLNQNLVTAGAARTVFVVAKKRCLQDNGGGLFTFRRGSGAIGAMQWVNSAGQSYIYSDGINGANNAAASTSLDTIVSSNPSVFTYSVPSQNAKIDFYLDGVQQTVSQAGNFADETGSSGFTVGDREDLSSFPWTGWIAEVIVYAKALTTFERQSVENYLQFKYATTGVPSQFSSLPAATVYSSNSSAADATWKHTYNTSDNTKLIASVKDNCLDLGIINSTVYNDATAGLYNGQRYMRRHYVIKPTLSPAGTKRVRLYYTNADFADLQTYIPTLTSASQLVVTKYDGPNEDGVFDPTGGTVTFIPSAQITAGTVFGVNYLEFDVTSFSEFWIHTGFTALPLKFISFSAQKCNDNNVCINWQTANEINVSHFEIERSTDGRTFNKVQQVRAKNQPANNYATTDDITTLLGNTNSYYRIKQIDANSKFSYSHIQLVKLNNDNIISIHPNPTSDILHITNYQLVAQVQLQDVSGRVVKQFSVAKKEIPMSDIPHGVYVLKLVLTNGEIVAQKIIKQ